MKLNLSSLATSDLEVLVEQLKSEINSRKSKKSTHNPKAMPRILSIHKVAPIIPKTKDMSVKEIEAFNQDFLVSTPNHHGNPESHEQYLPPLIKQDWGSIYARDTDDGDYYVYAHVDPRLKLFVTSEDAGGNYGGQPFYIGKGIGNRAFDLKRNEGHGKKIRDILKDGYRDFNISRILFKNLSEQKAFEIEAKLIHFFGTAFSLNRKGTLLNLDEPKTPHFQGKMKGLPKRDLNPRVAEMMDNLLIKDDDLKDKTYTANEVRELINKAIRERLERVRT